VAQGAPIVEHKTQKKRPVATSALGPLRLLRLRVAARRCVAGMARIFVGGVSLGGSEALGFNSESVQLIGLAPQNPGPLSL
jgi:hypothetical protein